MAFCRECGKQLQDNAKFCPDCGTPVNPVAESSGDVRREIYDGEVHKCPHCGESLNAFEIECPSCHRQIRGSKGSSAIKELSERLVAATSDKQRIIIIKNFPIPNTKEDIFEFMMLASSNFDSSYYAAHLHEEDMSDAWLIKVEQCYQKAKLMFGNDPDFAKIESEYLKIKQDCAEQESKVRYERKAQETAQQREESSNAFKKSKFKIVLIIFAIISAVFIAVAFNDGKTVAGIIGVVMLVAFLVSFLMGLNVIKEKVRRMHLIPAIIGFVLIIPYFALYSGSTIPSANYDTINWSDIELREYVPNLDKKGNVEENTETSLHIEFVGLTESDHNQVLKDVKAMGYTNVKFTNSVYYNAYNEDEYYLEVWWHDYSGEMDFYLDAPITMSTIDWSALILATELPNISSNEGVVRTNTSTKMDILVDDISESVYNTLVNDCKANGFTIDVVVDSETGSFEAFNSAGTKIEFKYNKFIQNLDIVIEAGETYSTFIWPSTKLVKTLPTPKSNVGKITTNSSYSFTVKVANTTFSDFQAYVNECVEKGYDDYYWWSDTSFSGDKRDGCTLTVKYLGNNVMEIHVYNYDY